MAKGTLTAGQLITFNVLLAYFLAPLQRLIDLQPVLQSAYVAASRLGEIMDLEPERRAEPDGPPAEADLRGDVVFRGLSFRYGSKPLTLDGLDLTVKQGTATAIVGPSGSGKSSLLKLLMRFYEPEEGRISIGGRTLDEIGTEGLRARTAYVAQDSFFFHGSVYDNLCLGLEKKPGLEEVVEVCRLAQIHEDIAALPLHYETVLEENGASLSGGQRQRLALARALLRKPQLLLLDEATSSLDTVTEQAIARLLGRLEGVTTILVSHRLRMVQACDQICVLKNGRIVECGDHDALLAQSGVYADMWESQ
ncbi:ATP-binding cassette domain-containing protein [Paenibacillus sp. CC-CFT747]|nr:ATP-binding cassette domain-containing protein [Paenibacillus sp. CC-CFT747]